ncbi:unnamed protein product [Cladocopium goreaui]|uniref:Transposase n=1 Tax=Cladocopium goreaui TaxID=2562237 RepID=A0A9P1DRT8_9DINO|nr:unnamed protein product [Cladocopium goreaui]
MAALIDEAMNTLGGKEWHYETRSEPCCAFKKIEDIGKPLTVQELLTCCRPPTGVKSTMMLLDVHLSVQLSESPEAIASTLQSQQVDDLPAPLKFKEGVPSGAKIGGIVIEQAPGCLNVIKLVFFKAQEPATGPKEVCGAEGEGHQIWRFGKWSDVEGDEATFDKRDVLSDAAWEHEVKADRSMLWEQWCGLVQRGKPQTLVLARLSPTLTATRSPGPGPITKQDWGPLGKKWLANRSVIFHTDSAKAYKMKLPGVLHDSVVHQKKRVKKNGKWEWTKPNFVKMKVHKLPGGKTVKVKCGTQHIDRCWKFIKERLSKGTNVRAGMGRLQAQIRSAQYWYRGDDMWVRTGELLSAYMSEIVDITGEKEIAAMPPDMCLIPPFVV